MDTEGREKDRGGEKAGFIKGWSIGNTDCSLLIFIPTIYSGPRTAHVPAAAKGEGNWAAKVKYS